MNNPWSQAAIHKKLRTLKDYCEPIGRFIAHVSFFILLVPPFVIAPVEFICLWSGTSLHLWKSKEVYLKLEKDDTPASKALLEED